MKDQWQVKSYHRETGLHLAVYGDIGELFGAITYGIKLNKTYAQGADGRLGNDHVEVKTITPFKRLCCTNLVRDSSCESSVIAGMHEQTNTLDIQDQELAGL